MPNRETFKQNKAWLEDDRSRLERGLSCMGPLFAEYERPGYGTHMADVATEAFEQAKDQAIRTTLQHSLELINKALEKIDKGTYGICENCGQPIEPGRLKALPHATLCISCQLRLERKR